MWILWSRFPWGRVWSSPNANSPRDNATICGSSAVSALWHHLEGLEVEINDLLFQRDRWISAGVICRINSCPSPAKLEKINLKALSQKQRGCSGFYLAPGRLTVGFLQISYRMWPLIVGLFLLTAPGPAPVLGDREIAAGVELGASCSSGRSWNPEGIRDPCLPPHPTLQRFPKRSS